VLHGSAFAATGMTALGRTLRPGPDPLAPQQAIYGTHAAQQLTLETEMCSGCSGQISYTREPGPRSGRLRRRMFNDGDPHPSYTPAALLGFVAFSASSVRSASLWARRGAAWLCRDRFPMPWAACRHAPSGQASASVADPIAKAGRARQHESYVIRLVEQGTTRRQHEVHPLRRR